VSEWTRELMWNGIAYATTAAASLLTLLGLCLGVPALRKRWLPLPRLRPGTWTGHEVFLAFCIVQGFEPLIIDLLQPMGFFVPLIGPTPAVDGPGSERSLYSLRCRCLSSPLSLTALLAMLFLVMFARSGSRPHHYGLSWGRWPANLGLGIMAFVLARPLVLGIFALSVLVFPQPADPLTALGNLNPPVWEWALFAFQMVVAAPLLEEILCRGILQGWLRRASLTGHLLFLTLTLFRTMFFGDLVKYDAATEKYRYQIAPVAFSILLAAGYGWTLYRLARRFALDEAEIQLWQPLPSEPSLEGSAAMSPDHASDLKHQARQRDEERARLWADANARLAIFGSAMLWAAIHTNWPAPIALFPMGLILGWLFHRTQSLLGPITFHALFNLATFIAFYGSVLTAPEPNGNAQTMAVRPSVVGSMTTSVPSSQLPLRK
jgi:membrane protease YdiL (CAAX protease family)